MQCTHRMSLSSGMHAHGLIGSGCMHPRRNNCMGGYLDTDTFSHPNVPSQLRNHYTYKETPNHYDPGEVHQARIQASGAVVRVLGIKCW